MVGIIGAGLLLNTGLLLMYWFPSPKHLVGDEVFFLMRAKMYLGIPVENTFWSEHPEYWSQLYARFLALMGGSRFAVQIIQILSLNVLGITWYSISDRLTGSKTAARATLALILLNPHLNAFSHYFWAEILHIALFSVSILILLMKPWKKIKGLSEGVSGLVLGVALFTKTMLLGFVPVIGLLLLIRRKMLRTASFSVGVLAVFFLMSLNREQSWEFNWNNVVYSYPLLAGLTAPSEVMESGGRPIVLRRGGREYYLFENADGQMYISQEEYHERVRFSRDFQEYVTMGEDRFRFVKQRIDQLIHDHGIFSLALRQLKKQYVILMHPTNMLIRQLPGGDLAAYQVSGGILPLIIKVYSYMFFGVLVLLFAAGIYFTWRQEWFAFFLLYLLYYIAMFFLMYASTRYRIQFEPVFAAFGGVALMKLLQWRKDRFARTS